MKRTITVILLAFFVLGVFGQEYKPYIKKELTSRSGKPEMVIFGKESRLKAGADQVYPKLSDVQQVLTQVLELNTNEQMVESSLTNDDYGYSHIKFQQYYKGYKVEDGEYFVHAKQNDIYSINGNIKDVQEVSLLKTISREEAIQHAINFVGAKTYAWEAEKDLYHPTTELVLVRVARGKETGKYVVAYKVDIYAFEPLSRAHYFINAATGEVVDIKVTLLPAQATGTAATRYSGSQQIPTDSYTTGYRLRDYSRGNGVFTRNLNNQQTSSGATDFIDNDNNWTATEYNNYKKDNAALEAHWAATNTYDYWKNVHNRNSYNGYGATINVYVHLGTNVDNAYWNGSEILLGDGGSMFDALVSMDIVAHEFGHAITTSTANLRYQNESGALNEAFSDIYAACVENYAAPNKQIWQMGEDVGRVLRSMSNPKSTNLPDTYKGQNWAPLSSNPSQSNDYGGVHTNGGCFNYWFYLICEGGSGTNDNGDSYTVSAIGMNKAEKIAFHAELNYMTTTTTYAQAREAVILSAKAIYGDSSPEEESVTNAMYAIGVGQPYNGGQTGGYCASNGQDASYEWIAGVTIGSFSNTSGTAGYSDFTNKTIQLSSGQATSLALTPGFSSTTYDEYWKIWIDLNGDEDFSDAGELVYDAGSMSKSTVNGSLTVPAGTAEITTRLRVSMKYNGAPTECESFTYGEVEDYTVHISSGSTGLQAPTNVIASGITYNSATITWSQVANATSYDVEYSTNGVNWTTLTAYSTSQNLTGLAELTPYQVRVRARNSSSTSPYSETETFTTTSQTTPVLDAPVNLSSSGITTSSFTVSWSAVQNATSYIAEIKPAIGGSWTAYTAYSPSYTFTGLTAGTQYQVRVAAANSTTQSNYSSILLVTTIDDNPSEYCSSSGLNASQTYIDFVSLYDLSNTSGTDGGYGNYTSKVANVYTGVLTSLYFRTNSLQTVYWKVWIDYNQNGTFDSSEEVASVTSTNQAYQMATITIPSSAASGATRMRVSAKVGSAPTACEVFGEGEVEDYTVNIISYLFNAFAENINNINNENAVNTLNLYPNPAIDRVQLQFAHVPETEISVYNSNGKLVTSVLPAENKVELIVSDYPAGLYFVKYHNGVETKISKFIKK